MNQNEAKQEIKKWWEMSRKDKAKYWDQLLPYINKYPNLFQKGKKNEKEKKIKN